MEGAASRQLATSLEARSRPSPAFLLLPASFPDAAAKSESGTSADQPLAPWATVLLQNYPQERETSEPPARAIRRKFPRMPAVCHPRTSARPPMHENRH